MGIGIIAQMIAGIALLVSGGYFLVRGAVSIAQSLKVSKIVVGLVIVSLGTSIPELFISVGAALSGNADLSLGNVVGSNIANIGLVLGCSVLILPIAIKRKSIIFDWSVLFGSALLLYYFLADLTLEQYEGIVLLSMLVLYILVKVRNERKSMRTKSLETKESEDSPPHDTTGLSALFMIIAVPMLYFGSEWLINGAVVLAEYLGVGERIIGLTVLAIGTSIPELATGVAAAIKKEGDIGVGNIVGSNIMNILFVLGTTASVKAIGAEPDILNVDMLAMIIISALLFLLMMFPISRARIGRRDGIILLAFYATYFWYIIQ